MRTLRLVFILLFALSLSAYGQDKSSLDQLKAEMARLEKELKRSESRERTILEKLEDLNREIGMRRRLLAKLEEEVRDSRSRIKETEDSLAANNASFARRKTLMAKRFVSLYKRGRISEWEALLSIDSFRKLVIWAKYQRMILDGDKRNLRILQEQKEEIERQRESIRGELARRQRLMNETRQEENTLAERKEEEKKLLAQVQQDTRSIQERLRQKRHAFDEISRTIREAEEKRKKPGYSRVASNITGLKGNLPWPVQGSVVRRYGTYTIPEYKISDTNIGIDIRASPNAEVRNVCRGRVIVAEFRRSMGNVVIVDQGDGYYLLYGYLSLVLVNVNQQVEEGEIIGRVGDRNSLHGPTLHFQIWVNGNHTDPQAWLKR